MSFSKQLDKIVQGKLWRFFGGIKPQTLKSTSNKPIEELGLPSLITLPLDRHLGEGGRILVSVGERVKAGQPLTMPGGKRNVPLHASTSGEVIAINPQILPHPSGFEGRCITIRPDGLDEAVEPNPVENWQEADAKTLLNHIRAQGVEGLGGAQFQTAAKIGAALEESTGECNIFIVNGAECEPVATCDDRLMQEKASEIVKGIEVVQRILAPKITIIAIENNKPNAIRAMKDAVDANKDLQNVQVRVIPTIYPSGAARNLIKICTGIEIPYSEHTSECGIVVDNVETVYAIKQAVIDGIPLIKRVITVDGQTLGKSGNALVRLGTSVRYILNAYKLNPERRQRIILGGPFMGFTLPTIDVPITKSVTCVYVPSYKEVEEKPEALNCIRCGRCARVCPSRLAPYQLYALSRASQHKRTKACGMMDCTECGCCAYVCPSRIALTAQFRKEKAILRLLDDQQKRSVRAQERISARNERLAKEEEQRQKRREAALARAKLLKEGKLTKEQIREQLAQEKAEQAGLIEKTSNAALETADKENSTEVRVQAVQAARQHAAAKRAAAIASGVTKVAGGKQRTLREIREAEEAERLAAEQAKAEAEAKAKAEAEEKERATRIPIALKKKDHQVQHAPEIFAWPEIKEVAPNLTKVENPPEEGVIIPESKPQAKTYLYATKKTTKSYMELPKRLRDKNYVEPVAKEDDKDTQASPSTEAKAVDTYDKHESTKTTSLESIATEDKEAKSTQDSQDTKEHESVDIAASSKDKDKSSVESTSEQEAIKSEEQDTDAKEAESTKAEDHKVAQDSQDKEAAKDNKSNESTKAQESEDKVDSTDSKDKEQTTQESDAAKDTDKADTESEAKAHEAKEEKQEEAKPAKHEPVASVSSVKIHTNSAQLAPTEADDFDNSISLAKRSHLKLGSFDFKSRRKSQLDEADQGIFAPKTLRPKKR